MRVVVPVSIKERCIFCIGLVVDGFYWRRTLACECAQKGGTYWEGTYQRGWMHLRIGWVRIVGGSQSEQKRGCIFGIDVGCIIGQHWGRI